MDKKLYLDCGSGISGDMFVAAMIDLGADPDTLEKALDSIPADGFFVEIGRVKKSGIDCCDFMSDLMMTVKTMIMTWTTFTEVWPRRQDRDALVMKNRTEKNITAIAMRKGMTGRHITAAVRKKIIIIPIGGLRRFFR